MKAWSLLLCALWACSEGSPPPPPPPSAPPCVSPLVLAASDLQYALTELSTLYEERHGCAPAISFGSTGAFTRQLEQGARADVFFAASASFIDPLVGAGLVQADSQVTYAVGRIVLVSPPGEAPPAALAALTDPGIRHLAIANPEHAPYGMAAEQALRAAGLLDAVAAKLVLGENIAQTWQLVETGNADAGVVALSLVLAREGARYTLIDASLHAPLVQVAAIPALAEHPEAGRAFLDLVGSPDGQAVMRRYGFVLPGE